MKNSTSILVAITYIGGVALTIALCALSVWGLILAIMAMRKYLG